MNGIHSGYTPVFAGLSLKKKLTGGAVGVALLATAACSVGGNGGDTKTSESPSKPPASSTSETPDAPSSKPSATKPPSATQFPSPSAPFSPPASPTYAMPTIYPKGTVTDKTALRQAIQDTDASVKQVAQQWPAVDLNKMTFEKRTMQEIRVKMKDSKAALEYVIDTKDPKGVVWRVKTFDAAGKLSVQMAFQENGNVWLRKADGPNQLIHKDFVKKNGLNAEFKQLGDDIHGLKMILQRFMHI